MTEAFDRRLGELQRQRDAALNGLLDAERGVTQARQWLDVTTAAVDAMGEARRLLETSGAEQSNEHEAQSRHPVKRRVHAYLAEHPGGEQASALAELMAEYHDIPTEATLRYLKRAKLAGELIETANGRFYLPVAEPPAMPAERDAAE